MLADILTKSLQGNLFRNFLDALLDNGSSGGNVTLATSACTGTILVLFNEYIAATSALLSRAVEYESR